MDKRIKELKRLLDEIVHDPKADSLQDLCKNALRLMRAIGKTGNYKALARLLYPHVDVILAPEQRRGNWYGIADAHTGPEALQDNLIMKIPVTLMVSIYQAAKKPDERLALAYLIKDPKVVHKLIVAAWKAGDLHEAALLYGSVYSEGRRDDILADTRRFAIDHIPTKILKALKGFSWRVFPEVQGIDGWLREELEDRSP